MNSTNNLIDIAVIELTSVCNLRCIQCYADDGCQQNNELSVAEVFDVVFCRNVLIYFDRETQEQVIGKLCNKLKSGGYLFIGHSESIMAMNLPLEQIKPTIFRRI